MTLTQFFCFFSPLRVKEKEEKKKLFMAFRRKAKHNYFARNSKICISLVSSFHESKLQKPFPSEAGKWNDCVSGHTLEHPSHPLLTL